MKLINDYKGTCRQDKNDIKTKFFLKISGHQQSVDLAFTGSLPHTFSFAGGR
jgi:hypothetical protein